MMARMFSVNHSFLVRSRFLTFPQKKDLVFVERKQLKEKPAKDFAYTFGGTSTDYMLECDYDVENGGW
jgi:hypothetical protein